MYNRYYPDEEGIYKKECMDGSKFAQQFADIPEIPTASRCPCEKNHMPPSKPLLQLKLDTGDLITILVYLTIAGDKEENRFSSLLTLAFYFLL